MKKKKKKPDISSTCMGRERIGNFFLGKCLGKGITGMVRLGKHMITGNEVAIKIIKKKYLDENPVHWASIKREIAILKLVNHPNILRLHNVLETQKRFYLILEHLKGGELFDYIIQKGHLDGKELARLFNQIIMGIEYCHSLWICHRDLKPENLLLNYEKNIKIVDFGFAQVSGRWNQQLRNTSCPTTHYTAPEVIGRTSKYNGTVSDVWSLGVVFYVMSTGLLPFENDNVVELTRQIMSGSFEIPSFVSPFVNDLISKMLVVDIKKRIKMEDIRKHYFFREHSIEFSTIPIEAPMNPCATLTNSAKLPVPWIDHSEFDESIIENLQALGWGSAHKIKKMLMDNNPKTINLSEKKQIVPNYRIARAMYLLFCQGRVRRLKVRNELFSMPKKSKGTNKDLVKNDNPKENEANDQCRKKNPSCNSRIISPKFLHPQFNQSQIYSCTKCDALACECLIEDSDVIAKNSDKRSISIAKVIFSTKTTPTFHRPLFESANIDSKCCTPITPVTSAHIKSWFNTVDVIGENSNQELCECVQSVAESVKQIAKAFESMKIKYNLDYENPKEGALFHSDMVKVTIKQKEHEYGESEMISLITFYRTEKCTIDFEALHMDLLDGLENISFIEC